MGPTRASRHSSVPFHVRIVRMSPVGIMIVLTAWFIMGAGGNNGELNINLKAANETGTSLRDFLVGTATALTGVGYLEEDFNRAKDPDMSVNKRSSTDMANMIARVKLHMAEVLRDKETAVKRLKESAESLMKQYGPYKEFIDFEEVNYFNAKKVVIDKDLDGIEPEYQPTIKGTIDFLPTNDYWDFNKDNLALNNNTSTVHVPTNIYDKSMKILNGVQWTENLTTTFVNNREKSPTLTWQYFCSSDGFFRVYPGMQWPRDPDKVDVFDCRMRQWYIQAASTPKNIIILLDTSGSMTGKRFTIAQSTVHTILDTLSDQDYFNIIKYSKVPEYVDPCFNGTLIPANQDNIRRMQEKIMDITTENQANLRDALKVAFNLFAEEEKHSGHPGSTICNKAIMIITDGAPENYVDVFNSTNWPEKATRVFTYLIGKEVSDDRKVKWMACVNKGEFTHISTKADVQENVQQYIKMLSRPLAQNKSNHHVWSSVYLDYSTEQSDITIHPYTSFKDRLDSAYEQFAEFKGLGLAISFSMPVYDYRTTVSKFEDEPSKNVLGVVGTDVRINDLVKLIPTYQLGVNGYAFAVTNHGYILFHPDYRPFYMNTMMHENTLKLRPKYNSVDLSEVELPIDHKTNMGHPLRSYLLTAQEGSSSDGGLEGNKTITVLTHFDAMGRARLQENHYQFIAVDNVFKLVFVQPQGYGEKYITVKKAAKQYFAKGPYHLDLMKGINSTATGSKIQLATWIYCKVKSTGKHVQLTLDILFGEIIAGSPEYECDEDQLNHLLNDIVKTANYAYLWNGSRYNPTRTSPEHTVRSQCLLPDTQFTGQSREKCIQLLYEKYGIDFVWIGTASGMTRYRVIDPMAFMHSNFEPDKRYTGSIRSLYYRRAVYGWEEGMSYVFFLDRSRGSKAHVVMSAAETVGREHKMPVAVAAFRMQHEVFLELFNNKTRFCPSIRKCSSYCGDSDKMNCYLIDNNGYIMAANNNATDYQSGAFLGKYDPALMRELIREKFFIELTVTDYQAMCTRDIPTQGSSSSILTTPFKWLLKLFLWLSSELALLLSHVGVRQWLMWPFTSMSSADDYFTDNFELIKSCTDDPSSPDIDPTVRYYLCNVVVDPSSKERVFVPSTSDQHPCIENMTRYTLNMTRIKERKEHNGSLTECGNCTATQNDSTYWLQWLRDTNLLLIMSAANCECATAKDTFVTKPQEVPLNENETCQRLFNFSKELKRVDNTRDDDALCLDSRDEEDLTCSQPSVHHSSVVLYVLLVLLSLWLQCC